MENNIASLANHIEIKLEVLNRKMDSVWETLTGEGEAKNGAGVSNVPGLVNSLLRSSKAVDYLDRKIEIVRDIISESNPLDIGSTQVESPLSRYIPDMPKTSYRR